VADEEGDDDDEVNVVDLMSEEEAAGAEDISDSGWRGGPVLRRCCSAEVAAC
jgi:hypothetical protein